MMKGFCFFYCLIILLCGCTSRSHEKVAQENDSNDIVLSEVSNVDTKNIDHQDYYILMGKNIYEVKGRKLQRIHQELYPVGNANISYLSFTDRLLNGDMAVLKGHNLEAEDSCCARLEIIDAGLSKKELLRKYCRNIQYESGLRETVLNPKLSMEEEWTVLHCMEKQGLKFYRVDMTGCIVIQINQKQ